MAVVALPPNQPPYVLEAAIACNFQVLEDPKLLPIVAQKVSVPVQEAQLLWNGNHLQVWSPANPRTPDHLCITCNHHVTRFEDLGKETYLELYQVMRKVRTKQPEKGFVTCHRFKDGHWEAHILPQRNEEPVKNLIDKYDSNSFVYQANTSPLPTHFDKATLAQERQIWTDALSHEPQLPAIKDTKEIWTLQKSHLDGVTELARFKVKQALENIGGVFQNTVPEPDLKAVDQPSTIIEQPMGKCPFCRPDVMAKQTIIARDGARLLYNLQGDNRFLIIMDQHLPEMLYAPAAQITAMYSIERDLRAALAKELPELAVVTFEQNMPSVGQTVREAHWQVVAYDQGSVFWTGISRLLNYETKGPSRISDAEMTERTDFWRAKIEQVVNSK